MPSLERLENALVSYAAYLGKMFWPVDLAIFYPYKTPLPLLEIASAAAVITLITFIALTYIKKLPFLFIGWCWYLGTLIPVIGLIQVGEQAMADRYTYLPSIGLAIMLTWSIPSFMKSMNIQKEVLFPAAIALLMMLSFLTWQQCGYWKNNFNLYKHALQATKNNHMAHRYLCAIYFNIYNIKDALYHCDKAIQINHVYADAYLGRGVCHAKLGQAELALADFQEAIRLKPNNADTYANRSVLYFKNGNAKLGCHDAQRACSLGDCHNLDIAHKKGFCQ
ncbi:MAG: Tetratricopeptide repeat protein [Bacteroidetes bacterium ADurb.BinA245]|nr:MAG: Tetratricopeptide repeat protein [Bacteroidetes bacterium ADurb.BinA245]